MSVFHDDHLTFLPKKARAKAVALDEQRSAAAAAMKAANADLEDAYMRRDRVEAADRTAGQTVRPGVEKMPLDDLKRRLAENDDAVTPAVAKITVEIEERIKPRLDRASEAFQAIAAVVDNAASWIGEAKRAGVKLTDAPTPAKPKSGEFLKEIDRVRNEIDEIEDALDRVEAAPCTLAEVRSAIIAEIDEIAERGRPNISYTNRAASPLRLDTALGFVNSPRGPRVAETIVWAMQDIIKERALSLVGDIEPDGALTEAQRDAEIDRLTAELLDANRREEAVITAAAAVGMSVPRRRDCDPRALLEIVETTPGWRSRFDVGLTDILAN
ncbi:hypothetical protein [Paenochrobactrum glaciei]|uniref:DUF222 domain-containing protein n=1 Tax=Paenochrobactrum glaciei TaxID=486407 RepID=A0ABP3RHS5_9HYPH